MSRLSVDELRSKVASLSTPVLTALQPIENGCGVCDALLDIVHGKRPAPTSVEGFYARSRESAAATTLYYWHDITKDTEEHYALFEGACKVVQAKIPDDGEAWEAFTRGLIPAQGQIAYGRCLAIYAMAEAELLRRKTNDG